MINLTPGAKVYLALGTTDMRKSIDGLTILIADSFAMDPFSGNIFAFCNRRRNNIKLIIWDRNGFWLLQKRLEKQLFSWPKSEKDITELALRELSWLLDGLDPQKIQGHFEEKYSKIC